MLEKTYQPGRSGQDYARWEATRRSPRILVGRGAVHIMMRRRT